MNAQTVSRLQSGSPHTIFEHAVQISPTFCRFFYRNIIKQFCHPPLIYGYYIRRNEQIQVAYLETSVNKNK